MKFKIKKNSKEEFFWTLVAKNGEIVCVSDEGYKTREGAVRSINLVKLESLKAEIEDTTIIFRRSREKE